MNEGSATTRAQVLVPRFEKTRNRLASVREGLSNSLAELILEVEQHTEQLQQAGFRSGSAHSAAVVESMPSSEPDAIPARAGHSDFDPVELDPVELDPMSGSSKEAPQPCNRCDDLSAELLQHQEEMIRLRDLLDTLQTAAFGNHRKMEAAELEIQDLQSEIDRLEKALESALSQSSSKRAVESTSSGSQSLISDSEAISEQQQRQTDTDEMLRDAIRELAELRASNAELEADLAQAKAATNGAGQVVPPEGLSWEDRKKAILRQLESECEAESGISAQDRLSIEQVIETTSAEIRRRDQEIAELKSLLQEQSNAHGGMAVGAAAITQMLEADELVQEEREKLRKITAEWQDKLRQAEIDISLERARLARERIEMEAKYSDYLEYKQRVQAEGADASLTIPAKPIRGKWLSRLGLKDEK